MWARATEGNIYFREGAQFHESDWQDTEKEVPLCLVRCCRTHYRSAVMYDWHCLSSVHDWRLFCFPEPTGHHHRACVTVSAVKFVCTSTNLLTYSQGSCLEKQFPSTCDGSELEAVIARRCSVLHKNILYLCQARLAGGRIMFSTCPFVRPFVCYKNCERDILKTS